jgi:hypothetical protein
MPRRAASTDHCSLTSPNVIALRSRDPDLVEQVFRRHAFAGVQLLLDDLD